MLFKSLMRPVANAVCKVPTRSTSAVVGAKGRHVSAGEKAILTSFMVVCWVGTPVWVLLHLKEYKGQA